MPLAASTDYPVLNLFWTIFEIFAFVIWFWLLFVILTDVFRSSDLSGLASRYVDTAWKNHSAASTVLYSGGSPPSGKRLGSIPRSVCCAKVRRIAAASSMRPVGIVRPGSAIMVSRPQSLNHG